MPGTAPKERTLKLEYTRRAVLQGTLVYAAGDAAGMLIVGHWSWTRLVGILLVGATVYALEIPNYFRWIERTVAENTPLKRATYRTALALLYFNPLWISRHFAFLYLAEGRWSEVNLSLLSLGLQAWLGGIPFAIVGNYVIQVRLPLEHRFVGSAVFSGIMAAYYALSKRIFDG